MIFMTVASLSRIAISAGARRRQWSKSGRGLDVPRRETGHDADAAGANRPLLRDDVPVADIASGEIERHGLAFAGL